MLRGGYFMDLSTWEAAPSSARIRNVHPTQFSMAHLSGRIWPDLDRHLDADSQIAKASLINKGQEEPALCSVNG